MFNDFKETRRFLLVVPVLVVLKKSDIKVVDQQIFKMLNEYSQPNWWSIMIRTLRFEQI
jgi:hypothetical protein